MPKFSVKKPFTVLVMVIVIMILGVVCLSSMTTDLLPEMNLPYMIVITTYPGASPEKVESSVCEPMERALGSVSGVKMYTAPPMKITASYSWNLWTARTWIRQWSRCPVRWMP